MLAHKEKPGVLHKISFLSCLLSWDISVATSSLQVQRAMEGRNRETGRRPHSYPSSSFPNARGPGRGRGRGRFFSSKPIPNPAISDHLPSLDGRDVDEKESAAETAEAAFPNFAPLIGTCPDMCPARERVQRERLRDLSVFERLNGNPGRTTPSLAVKKVRFHVISNHKLPRCGKNPNVSSLHYLNMEQLMKSLKSLYELYDINRRSNSTNKNEAEFYSFYVLLHLGPNSHSMGESLCPWLQRLASPIIKSNEMCFARSVLRYFRVGNYKHFFSTISAEASYLQLCLLEPVINEVIF